MAFLTKEQANFTIAALCRELGEDRVADLASRLALAAPDQTRQADVDAHFAAAERLSDWLRAQRIMARGAEVNT